MFCPKCKSEYKEGFYKCADCGVYLVSELPQTAARESGDKFVQVFSTYNQGEIAFIKSVLDVEDITYFFQGEGSAMMVGAGAYARLLVKAEEAERAREILKDLGFI